MVTCERDGPDLTGGAVLDVDASKTEKSRWGKLYGRRRIWDKALLASTCPWKATSPWLLIDPAKAKSKVPPRRRGVARAHHAGDRPRPACSEEALPQPLIPILRKALVRRHDPRKDKVPSVIETGAEPGAGKHSSPGRPGHPGNHDGTHRVGRRGEAIDTGGHAGGKAGGPMLGNGLSRKAKATSPLSLRVMGDRNPGFTKSPPPGAGSPDRAISDVTPLRSRKTAAGKKGL